MLPWDGLASHPWLPSAPRIHHEPAQDNSVTEGAWVNILVERLSPLFAFFNRRKSACPNWGTSSQSDKPYAPEDVHRPPTWITAPLLFQSLTLTPSHSYLRPDTLFPPRTITLSLRPSPTPPAFTSQMARSAATTATPAVSSFSTSEAIKYQGLWQEENLD